MSRPIVCQNEEMMGLLGFPDINSLKYFKGESVCECTKNSSYLYSQCLQCFGNTPTSASCHSLFSFPAFNSRVFGYLILALEFPPKTYSILMPVPWLNIPIIGWLSNCIWLCSCEYVLLHQRPYINANYFYDL